MPNTTQKALSNVQAFVRGSTSSAANKPAKDDCLIALGASLGKKIGETLNSGNARNRLLIAIATLGFTLGTLLRAWRSHG